MFKKAVFAILIVEAGVLLTSFANVVKPPTKEVWLPSNYILVSDYPSPKLVRAAVARSTPVDTLELYSQLMSIDRLSSGMSMSYQYFDESYNLNSWDHQVTVSAGDRQHFLGEIEVHYIPSENTPPTTLSNYKTIARLPSGQ